MREAWVAAGAALAADPSAKVRCPDCSDADLAIDDRHAPNASAFERHLTCPSCGAHAALRMLRRDGG